MSDFYRVNGAAGNGSGSQQFGDLPDWAKKHNEEAMKEILKDGAKERGGGGGRMGYGGRGGGGRGSTGRDGDSGGRGGSGFDFR